MIPLFFPYVPKDAIEEVVFTLYTRWIGQGPKVDQFEKDFSTKFNQPYCVSVNSGSAALETAYELVGIKPGDEVILPRFTFVATEEAILSLGGVPVYCGIDDNLTLNSNELRTLITPNTAASRRSYDGIGLRYG